MKRIFWLGLSHLILFNVAEASGVKVGNGNDGRDLENLIEIQSGVLADARAEAVRHLKQLNVEQIPHLGILLPEVEKTKLLLATSPVQNIGNEEHRQLDLPEGKQVYARTMPQPHSPTRFFPPALQLSMRQLVALQIHEGLHRALPALVRENEETVAEITTALMAPDASHDSIKAATIAAVAEGVQVVRIAEKDENPMTSYSRREVRQAVDEVPRFGGSSVGFNKTIFNKSLRDDVTYKSMDVLAIRWGERLKNERILMVGLDFSQLQTKTQNVMGPIQLLGEVQFPWRTDLNVRAGARYSMNTLAEEEYRTNPIGRQVAEVFGTISYVKNQSVFLDAELGSVAGSTLKQKIGNVEYEHRYGSTTRIGLGFGAFRRQWELGAHSEIQLMENYQINGGAFSLESGPLRVVKLGPKGLVRFGEIEVSAAYTEVISSTKDLALESMGDLFGAGIGQKSFTVGVAYVF